MRQNKGGNVRSGSHNSANPSAGLSPSNQLEDNPPRTSPGKIIVNLLTC